MLKIGVLGAGHLGKIHLRLLNESDRYQLVGFYDPDRANAEKVSLEFGYKSFDSIDELIAAVDVVDVVTPTIYHYDCAIKAIEKGKHIFLEKPITSTMEQASELIAGAHKRGLKGQVGHVERFNPAFTAARPYIKNPMFIETHRLAEFNPRGTDVPVVLDLMIHDIDIVLSIVQSPVKNITASGAKIISNTPDIANARIEFENGCVANLTTSRISLKNMRKLRIFQRDAYITVDYLAKKSEVVRITEAPANPGPYDMILQTAEGERRQIYFEKPEVTPNNAILDELNTFADAINTAGEPMVSLRQGAQALEIALKIERDIEEKLKTFGV